MYQDIDDQHFYCNFDAQRSCEDRGETDARRGFLISECPYQDAQSIAEWQKGWNRVNERRMVYAIHRI